MGGESDEQSGPLLSTQSPAVQIKVGAPDPHPRSIYCSPVLWLITVSAYVWITHKHNYNYAYQFKIIPIELISSIYEEFLHKEAELESRKNVQKPILKALLYSTCISGIPVIIIPLGEDA